MKEHVSQVSIVSIVSNVSNVSHVSHVSEMSRLARGHVNVSSASESLCPSSRKDGRPSVHVPTTAANGTAA